MRTHCVSAVKEDPLCVSHLQPLTQLLSHPSDRQMRDARKEPRTHMIRVDPFIDLPKEAFTKNTIKNHIFTGNTILWTCIEGENRGGISQNPKSSWPPQGAPECATAKI